MMYIIYKTTNIINNKFYIGLHETNNLNDDYLGSGIFLKKAIKKYGKENFEKEILHIFDNKQEMIMKEMEIVNLEFISRRDTYNMSMGGFGLSTLSNNKKLKAIKKMKITKKNQDHSESSKKRLNTMLASNKDIFKEIGIMSSIKQKENYKNGYVNPRTDYSIVNIFNEKDEIVFSVPRHELSLLCKNNNLPERVLLKSLHNNGIPLYYSTPPSKPEFLKYRCWYSVNSNSKRVNMEEYIAGKRNLMHMSNYLIDKEIYFCGNVSFIL